jgi:hypothetical protein
MASSPRVPDELMQRLHDANNAFAAARSKLKNPDAMETKQRRDAADALRSAEKEVETCENAIASFLKSQEQSPAS